jgi:putative hemolysin
LWFVQNSYSAQFYDLEALLAFNKPMIELGQFCIHPDLQHQGIIRIAWAALRAYVDECQISMLFGCTSFAGTDTSVQQEVFELLGKRHAGPSLWIPQVKAREVCNFKRDGRAEFDTKQALARMPPLLRNYLLMGAGCE